jgi:hypothetical protein
MRKILCTLVPAIASAAAFAQQLPIELPTQQVSPSFPDTGSRPTDAQARKLVEQTYAYFAAKDEGRFADAYSTFSISQKRAVSFDGWKALLEDFYRKAGSGQGRKLQKITWYKNPPNTQPGVYAAVDFTGQFANLSLYCGFVAWRQQMDGSFELVREEANSIEKSVAEKMTPDMMQRARSQFRC